MKTRTMTKLIAAVITALALVSAGFPSPAAAGAPGAPTAVRGTPVTRIKALVNLNIRSGPGTGFARTGRLSAGEVRTVIGISNNLGWWHVSCADGTGWVSADPHFARPVAWRR